MDRYQHHLQEGSSYLLHTVNCTLRLHSIHLARNHQPCTPACSTACLNTDGLTAGMSWPRRHGKSTCVASTWRADFHVLMPTPTPTLTLTLTLTLTMLEQRKGLCLDISQPQSRLRYRYRSSMAIPRSCELYQKSIIRNRYLRFSRARSLPYCTCTVPIEPPQLRLVLTPEHGNRHAQGWAGMSLRDFKPVPGWRPLDHLGE